MGNEILKYNTKEYIITTPKGLEGINDDLDDDLIKDYFKENEKSISIHELLVRSCLLDLSLSN